VLFDTLLAFGPVERLLAYIEEHASELSGDLLPSLLDVDAVFREVAPEELARCVHEALWRFTQYARTRDPLQLDACWRVLQSLWPDERSFFSAVVRVLFGFEDLLAVRAGRAFRDAEVFLDELRIFRVAMREALCLWADRLQGRYAAATESLRETRLTQPVGRTMQTDFADQRVVQTIGPAELTPDLSPVEAEIEARWAEGAPQRPAGPLVTGVTALAHVRGDRFVGRQAELARLWERLAAVGSAGAAHHEVVGLKGPDGWGKTRLVQRFQDAIREQLGVAPLVVRARAPRLFTLPTWPFVQLFRGYFEASLHDPELGEKVRRGLLGLVEYLPDEAARQALLEGRTVLLDLLGEPEAASRAAQIDGRTLGIKTHRAIVQLLEAIAARAAVETNAPLILEIEDAGELDGPSWELLHHLLVHVRPRARILVLLTYDGRFYVPAELSKYPGFTEITLSPFEMADSEALIDTMLEPNALQDSTRFRLISGARGSPLLLRFNLEQLVIDGVVGLEQGRWHEARELPADGVDRELGDLIKRRLTSLGDTAREVAEVVAVTEDASGGNVLEDVAQRRAIDREELFLALQKLERLGLVEISGSGLSLTARASHGLVHDEIYKQMNTDRRRAIHEDAGEVYTRLPTTASFPSLAADHLALAGLHGRALHGLMTGIDRSVRVHSLVGALELCNQAIGLLKGMPRDEQDRHLFQVLLRRERINGLLGHRDQQASDLRQLEPLALRIGTESERAQLAHRRARHALLTGSTNEVAAALAGWSERPTPRSRFVLALTHWQQGERGPAVELLDGAAEEAVGTSSDRLRARIAYARGVTAARNGKMAESLRDLFEAWRASRRSGDVYGEALTIQALGNHFWTVGRLMDADRLLRRSERLMSEAGETRARARVLVQLGGLHASMGDLDEASQFFGAVLQTSDRDAHRFDHAAAIIGQSRILVSRGRYEEATALVAQCIKDVGRRGGRHPVLVDLHNALAMTFAVAARGERLVVGALNYAGEAADRATELGYLRGLVSALGIQVRALLALGRDGEAASRLHDLDTAFESALQQDPRLERLRAEVELYRHGVKKALGDMPGADQARQAAWNELMSQVRCLEGTGFERGFLNNILPHREILQAMERVPANGP